MILISRWFAKRKVRKQLQNCNYEMAKTVIIRKFSGGVIPKELVDLLDAFISNPCFDTAVKLIEYDSKFLVFFELSRCEGFTEHLFQQGDLK
jgi:hypothetical protein